MTIQDQLLALVKEKGPLIPSDIYRELKKDNLTTSAMLSELVSRKMVKISALKHGGSPLYYVSGQEEKLQGFAHLLHEKERKAYDMLLREKILRDRTLEPIIRVALRQLKDFATPLTVSANDGQELFWKWYMESNSAVEPLIKQVLGIAAQTPLPARQELQQELPKPIVKERPLPRAQGSGFLDAVLGYFSLNGILVQEKEIVRKNEVDFVIELPSKLGNLIYYCKAKSKKRSSDTDLSSAFTQGQFRKLPVLYLHDGDLSKKAKELLATKLTGITVRSMQDGR